jgi:GMP synthase (glutamine-hydrolysing)
VTDPAYLLLQCRDAGDPMRAHEVDCFRAALSAPTGGIRVVDALDGLPSARDVRGARGILMGGSGDYSSLDEHPWIRRLIGFAREELLRADVPIFASCFGLQILTLSLGGQMVRDPANREVGSIDLHVTPAAAGDPVFGALPRTFVAQAGHTDRATAAPPGTDLLASSDRCPVNAFRVRGKPVWATQFHPELDPGAVTVRYLRYMEKYPPTDLPAGTPLTEAPFLKRLRPSEHATRLLARFADVCAARLPVGA